MIIKYVGLRNLNKIEVANIKELVLKYSKKLDIKLKNSTLVFDVKKYEHENAKTKYSVHARVDSPHTMLAVKRSGWDLRRTLHGLLQALEKQMQHKIKGIERGFTKDYEKSPKPKTM